MIDVLVVIKFPDLKKERLRHWKRKKVVVVFFFVSRKFRKLWSFLEPKEEHYSGSSSRIKGCKTWEFSKEKWKKVLDVEWILCGVVEWILCGARVVDLCGAR